MSTRFCPYCRQFREDEGFKFVLHVNSGTRRGQCTGCQETRKLPRKKLEEMAARDSVERRQKQSEIVKKTNDRNKNENPRT